MSGTGNQFYPEEEADEILRLAAGDSINTTEMTRDRLIAVAAELGISAEAVARAEEKVAAQKVAALQEKDEAELFARYKQKRRQSVLSSLSGWLSTSVVLIGINLLTDHRIDWAIWPVGIWGLFEIGQVIEALMTPVARDERFDRWKRKQARRRDRQNVG